MKKSLITVTTVLSLVLSVHDIHAQTVVPTARPRVTRTATPTVSPTPSETPVPTVEPVPTQRPDITQRTEESVGPLEKILKEESLGAVWKAPLKHVIARAVKNGVPANTVVLLLLLPVVAAFVAGARHLLGLQGFGILLPAALAISFLALGPIVGIGMFLVIIGSSTLGRMFLRKIKLRLHYLPRMSLLLAFTVLCILGVLLLGSTINVSGITNVSIFPVLFLVLLSEDFIRVQLGKSFHTAVNITAQTLLLALVSYFFLTLSEIQMFAIKYPEILIGGVLVINIVLGKFSGLRLLEYYRFRKLIKK